MNTAIAQSTALMSLLIASTAFAQTDAYQPPKSAPAAPERAQTKQEQPLKITNEVAKPQSEGAMPKLVLSANGPGAGHTAIAFGGTFNDAVTGYADFMLAAGLTDRVSLDLSLRTQILDNRMNFGPRFHIVKGQSLSFSLETKLREQHFFKEDVNLLMLGVLGGARLSWGSENIQWTAGLSGDAMIFGWIPGDFAAVGAISYDVRTTMGLEFSMGSALNGFAQLQFENTFVGDETFQSFEITTGLAF